MPTAFVGLVTPEGKRVSRYLSRHKTWANRALSFVLAEFLSHVSFLTNAIADLFQRRLNAINMIALNLQFAIFNRSACTTRGL